MASAAPCSNAIIESENLQRSKDRYHVGSGRYFHAMRMLDTPVKCARGRNGTASKNTSFNISYIMIFIFAQTHNNVCNNEKPREREGRGGARTRGKSRVAYPKYNYERKI